MIVSDEYIQNLFDKHINSKVLNFKETDVYSGVEGLKERSIFPDSLKYLKETASLPKSDSLKEFNDIISSKVSGLKVLAKSKLVALGGKLKAADLKTEEDEDLREAQALNKKNLIDRYYSSKKTVKSEENDPEDLNAKFEAPKFNLGQVSPIMRVSLQVDQYNSGNYGKRKLFKMCPSDILHGKTRKELEEDFEIIETLKEREKTRARAYFMPKKSQSIPARIAPEKNNLYSKNHDNSFEKIEKGVYSKINKIPGMQELFHAKMAIIQDVEKEISKHPQSVLANHAYRRNIDGYLYPELTKELKKIKVHDGSETGDNSISDQFALEDFPKNIEDKTEDGQENLSKMSKEKTSKSHTKGVNTLDSGTTSTAGDLLKSKYPESSYYERSQRRLGESSLSNTPFGKKSFFMTQNKAKTTVDEKFHNRDTTMTPTSNMELKKISMNFGPSTREKSFWNEAKEQMEEPNFNRTTSLDQNYGYAEKDRHFRDFMSPQDKRHARLNKKSHLVRGQSFQKQNDLYPVVEESQNDLGKLISCSKVSLYSSEKAAKHRKTFEESSNTSQSSKNEFKDSLSGRNGNKRQLLSIKEISPRQCFNLEDGRTFRSRSLSSSQKDKTPETSLDRLVNHPKTVAYVSNPSQISPFGGGPSRQLSLGLALPSVSASRQSPSSINRPSLHHLPRERLFFKKDRPNKVQKETLQKEPSNNKNCSQPKRAPQKLLEELSQKYLIR